MKKKYLLPALENSVGVDAKDCWESMDNVYDYLTDNLKLSFEPNASVFQGGSNATPHMFEQMFLFHKAFFDEQHAEHARAVMEWRAILSIMALQRVCNVRLDLVRVDLLGEDSSPFLKAAYDFRPEDAPVFYNSTWDFLYVLRLKGVPIAIFSPITLVCPAKQFARKIDQNLDNNWVSILSSKHGDKLIFRFHGKRSELTELCKWLEDLRGAIRCSNIDGSSRDKYKKVIKELELFAEKCGKDVPDDGDNPLLRGIYESINNSIRKEYDFLNGCCNVNVKNEKLQFLVKRYREDIFENRVLVLVYDEAPDAMIRKENVGRLEKLYRDILEIKKGEPIIEVHDNSGDRIAACVLLPFKEHFVRELIQNGITPNEFFGDFSAVYDPVRRLIQISLQITEFPFYFQKSYEESNWQYLYGRNMEATYIWPTAQVDAPGWKNYFIYTGEMRKLPDDKDSQIEVSVPEAVSQVKYLRESDAGFRNEFQLCKSHSFPAYLCYTYQEVAGYLPISTRHVGTDEVGATANIVIDMGHATTSIYILKESGGDVQENTRKGGHDVYFGVPRSGRIAGNPDRVNAVNMNFVIPNEEKAAEVSNYIKNMMHSFQKYKKMPVIAKERKPFEDGQLLFDSSAYLNKLQEAIVSYISYEYALMDQIGREKVHIFVEQLLVYAAYQIIAWECSYIRVYFLHYYERGDARLGELKGLWKNALANVRRRTGISPAGSEDAIAVGEHEALAHYVYEQVYKENMSRACQVPSDCIYVGMNIGWKNTGVVILSKEGEQEKKEEGKEENTGKQEQIAVRHTMLEYAGKNISMMADAENNQLNLPVYPKLLQILLGGQDLSMKPDIQKMIEEFGELFADRKKDTPHYQGVFDAIAMKIEEEGYHVSPDVFNNMPEFRYYIMALTYNILLLFLNVGALLKEHGCEQKKQIYIYLGGNGAKFLQWISNHKDFKVIKRAEAHELLILPMQNGIIEFLAASAGVNVDEVEIRIILSDRMEEQLVQGCRTMMFDKDIVLPNFRYQKMEPKFTNGRCADLVQVIRDLRREVFRDFPSLELDRVSCIGHLQGDVSMTNLIENERKEVDAQVIKEITYINDKQY